MSYFWYSVGFSQKVVRKLSCKLSILSSGYHLYSTVENFFILFGIGTFQKMFQCLKNMQNDDAGWLMVYSMSDPTLSLFFLSNFTVKIPNARAFSGLSLMFQDVSSKISVFFFIKLSKHFDQIKNNFIEIIGGIHRGRDILNGHYWAVQTTDNIIFWY